MLPRCFLSGLAKRVPLLVTMQLEERSRSLFQTLFTPHLKQLKGIFDTHGHEIRLAGGAVRDLLTLKAPHDLDFATTATPDEMVAMFNAEGVRMINTNGLAHGTVTVRIGDAENFEVTTLRIDRVTDGRHAVVEFTRDWALDANRRDLTVNSMFLGLDGLLYDYFEGRNDLAARRVRFVGEPGDRIREDYLRILRYFRFHGRLGIPGSLDHPVKPGTDEAGMLSAIEANAAGLARVAGERLWVEMRQILCGQRPVELVRAMAECGVTRHLGLGDAPDVDELQAAIGRAAAASEKQRLHPATCLAAMLKSAEEVEAAHVRLKLSNEELGIVKFVVDNRAEATGSIIGETQDKRLQFYQDLAALTSGKDPRTRQRVVELLLYCGEAALLSGLDAWWPPKFPVSGNTLASRWGLTIAGKGPVLGRIIDQLRIEWQSTRFAATEDDLLADAVRDRVLERLGLTGLRDQAPAEKANCGQSPPPAKMNKTNRNSKQ